MSDLSRIPLSGNLVLRADATAGWIISERRRYGSGKRAGEEYDYDLKYPGSLFNALITLREMNLVRSGSTTLEALIESDRRFQKQLSAFFEPRLAVSIPKGVR